MAIDLNTVQRSGGRRVDLNAVTRPRLGPDLNAVQRSAQPLTTLADEYDEFARGKMPHSPEATAEIARALDDPIGLKTYRDAVGMVAAMGASALVPGAPLTTGPMLARVGLGAASFGGGAAVAEGVKAGVTGEVDPNAALNIGVATGIGAAVPLGLAGLANSASSLYRVLGKIPEVLKTMPGTLNEADAALPAVQAQLEARAAMNRGTAAREAFRAHVPEGSTRETVGDIIWNRAIKAARRAAVNVGGKGPIDTQGDDALMHALTNNVWNVAAKLPGGHHITAVMDDLNQLRYRVVTNAADAMRRNIAVWGNVGSQLAHRFVRNETLAQQLEGERWGWAERELVQGMNRTERINFTEAAAGEAKPLNDKIAEAVQKFRALSNRIYQDGSEAGLRMQVPATHSVGQMEMFDDVAQRAELLGRQSDEGMRAVPLQYRTNYVPHFRDADALAELATNGSARRTDAINHIVKTYGMTGEEATAMLDDIVKKSSPGGWEFDHTFQYARDQLMDDLGVPWEKDSSRWLPHWLHITSRRLARAKVWGAQDEVKKGLYTQMETEGHDTAPLDKFWRNFIGHPAHEDNLNATLAKYVGTGLTITGLGPKVGVLQYLQLANPIAKFGYKRTLAALKVVAEDPEMRQFVNDTGALLPSKNMSWIVDDVTDWGTWWVKYMTNMPQSDRFVRMVSSVAAGIHAVDAAKQIGAGAADDTTLRLLESLGVPLADVIKQEGRLTVAQVRAAMMNGSNVTQFSSSATSMPLAWKTPMGRWIYKFRTFAKQQSNFVQKEVIGEAQRGNFAPAVRYLSAYAGLYEAAAPILDFISGVDRREDREAAEVAWDKLQSYMYAGMLGGMGDTINVASNSTAARVAGYVAGPAVGNALLWGEAVHTAVQNQDFGPLASRARRTVPLVGGWWDRYVRSHE